MKDRRFIIVEEDSCFRIKDTELDMLFPRGKFKRRENAEEIMPLIEAICSSPKVVMEYVRNPAYTDNGYLETVIAQDYFAMNPEVATMILAGKRKRKRSKKSTQRSLY